MPATGPAAAAARDAWPTAPSLEIVRTFQATPERVFDALTRPEDLVHWFGPSPAMVVTVEAFELLAGGRWKIAMAAPNGEQHGIGGTILEVERPHRLVMSWAWQSTPERMSRVTFELTATSGGTRLLLTHDRFFDDAARDRHQAGWSASLDRLAAYISAP